jgi:hypothetical protein
MPRDPTIRARFNTHRLADKERVIDLLTRVSVDPMATVAAMRAQAR